MVITSIVKIWFYILIILQQTADATEISFNQPKLPGCPQWNPNGITFANETLVGEAPLDIFVDRNDIIYVTNEYNEEVHLWNANSVSPITITLDHVFDPWGLFVTIDREIYIGSETTGQVERWTVNATKGIVVMDAFGSCSGLFIDMMNYLYCSMGDRNQVVKRLLDEDLNILIVVAGNSTKGLAENMLDGPRGIFVTTKFDLYVADCWNDRIQFFKFGEENGITVTESINLRRPTGVFFDGDGYLYIIDNGNHRIIGSRSNGFYCIVGCSSIPGSTSSHLNYPYTAVFDHYGNIFVSDQDNNRIQKFLLITNNSTKESYPIESIYSSALTEDSPMFTTTDCRTFNYYYQAIQVEVIENGCYDLIINSTFDVFSYIYEDYFKPVTPTDNLFSQIGRDHSELQMTLLINTKYILVVTTFNPTTTGVFSVITTGPNGVNFDRINASWAMQAEYSSELVVNGQIYSRARCGLANYYYEAIAIHVIETGYYAIISNSTIDTDGFIYENQFDVFNSRRSLILDNADSGCNHQFKILIRLQVNTTYILVVTTSSTNVTGAFSVLVFGPNNISMNYIDDISPVIQSTYSSALTANSQRYGREGCKSSNYYYEAIRINVRVSGLYTLSSDSGINTYGYLYKNHFNPMNPTENSFAQNDEGCANNQFQLIVNLQSNFTYVLVVTTYFPEVKGKFMIFGSGPSDVNFKRISIQSMYASVLTKDTQRYSRVCGRTNYYYETIEVNVQENSTYRFDSNSTIITYGYIYEHSFDPFNPTENLLVQSNYSCGGFHFQFSAYLRINTTYVLVVTTFHPNVNGEFSVLVHGSNNVSLRRIVRNGDSCVIGDRCNSYTKGIGMILDDILRNEIRRDTPLNDQSLLVKISVALTMIMFAGGLINSILSLITFRNVELRIVGCGMYLLSSSITSLLTISMLTIKFWFVLLIQIDTSIDLSVLRRGCISVEPLLKFFVYLDNWLTACVAVERAVNVSQGIKFDRKKSKRLARWIIILLPIVVMTTIVHEPIHRNLLEYTTEKYERWINESMNNETEIYETEKHVLCVINYSRSVQDYNTVILFFHLIGPFIANLLSALYIIFGSARQRSLARTHQTYKEHLFDQLNQHKQLVISPVILLILSLPRLIISLVSGCVDASSNPWLYLCGYFISFTPSMLIFVVFVFPSELYMKTFKQSLSFISM